MNATTPLPASALPPVRRIASGTMLAYGFGAVAYGVKDSGFGTFLLLFYNQVIGLPAATVGLVIMLALVIDAIIDPAVGFFSDRTRSRWGRRHPWMYAAALPIAVGWALLWHPPEGWSSTATLLWLFVAAVLVRSAVSCYEVPSVALTAELTADYDERTRIMAYRYLFGWAGGLTMLVSAYGYFLANTPAFPNGLLNRAGYAAFGLAGAVLMATAILVSATGTHHEIKNLPKQLAVPASLRHSFAELRQTVKNRAFLMLMLGGVCAYTNQGINYALSNYMYTYVWGFAGWIMALVPAVLFAGVFISFLIAPRLSRRFGKPRAATVLVIIAALFNTLPYLLRYLRLLPDMTSTAGLALLFFFFIGATAVGVSGFIIGASMMADVVEDSEARTGIRSEGVFFAGSFFVQKCTSGLGIFVAGLILAFAGFPEAAKPGEVPAEALDRLTLIFAALYLTLACIAAFFFSRFPFGRAEHEARVGAAAG
jgi:glycoside/pentoside/hexuronide:cation symporter, GPH family